MSQLRQRKRLQRRVVLKGCSQIERSLEDEKLAKATPVFPLCEPDGRKWTANVPASKQRFVELLGSGIIVVN